MKIACEWRAFGDIDSKVRRKIEALKSKYANPDKLDDDYIFRPGCEVNTKIRKDLLKFKRRVQKTEDGIEVFEILDMVRIDASGLETLAKEMGTAPAKRLIVSPHELRSALGEFNPPLFLIRTAKVRRQYLDRDDASLSIELAEVQKPTSVQSVCIEHDLFEAHTLDVETICNRIRKVRDDLGLPGGMKVKGYLDVLDVWRQLNRG